MKDFFGTVALILTAYMISSTWANAWKTARFIEKIEEAVTASADGCR